MKALKDYGIKPADLKTAVKGLNDSGFIKTKIKSVAVKGENLLVAFMDAYETVPDKQLKDLPTEVNKFYDDIPQAVFDDAPADTVDAPEEVEQEEVEEGAEPEEAEETATVEEGEEASDADCPTFGDQNMDEDDCQACKDDYPDEFAACTKATATAKAAAKKKKVAKPKNKAKKSRYGHLLNSMAGDIDDLLYIGCNLEDMVQVIAEKHDRTEQKARAKIRAHAGYLVDIRGLKLHDNEGFMQIKVPYLKGFNKDNTTVVFEELPPIKKKKAPAKPAADKKAADKKAADKKPAPAADKKAPARKRGTAKK